MDGWTAEQVGNAAAVVAAGVELGVSAKGQVMAVLTAMGESRLHVLEQGDTAGPDSRGLFQQRDDGAWGPNEDRMNPRISSLNFYRALLEVDGWQARQSPRSSAGTAATCCPTPSAWRRTRAATFTTATFFAQVAAGATPRATYDAVPLDIDHSPQHLLHPSHGAFYSPRDCDAWQS